MGMKRATIAIISSLLLLLSGGIGEARARTIAPAYDTSEPEILRSCTAIATCTGSVIADVSTGRQEIHLVNQTPAATPGAGAHQTGLSTLFVTHTLKKATSSVAYRLSFHLDGARSAADPTATAAAEVVVELDVLTADGGCCAAGKVAHILDTPNQTVGAQDILIDLVYTSALAAGTPITLRVLLYGDVSIGAGAGTATLDVTGTAFRLTADPA